MKSSYFRPPDEAHESPEDMAPWGQLALESATRAASAKRAKARKKPGKPAGKAPRPGGSPRSRPATSPPARPRRPWRRSRPGPRSRR
jgi:DNA transformation protein